MQRQKKPRPKSTRISTTLPQMMVENLKDKATVSGVSVSRLIYLQLKTRKPIIVASDNLIEEVRELRQVLKKIIATGCLDVDSLEILRKRVKFYETLVDLNREAKTYVS